MFGNVEFDLFKAMAHINDAVGDSGELDIQQRDSGFLVIISKTTNDQLYHSAFSVTFKEISQGNINILAIKFYDALNELKKL